MLGKGIYASVESQIDVFGANCHDLLFWDVCTVCSLPAEYCEFGPDFEKCKPWLVKNAPELYPALVKGIFACNFELAAARFLFSMNILGRSFMMSEPLMSEPILFVVWVCLSKVKSAEVFDK